MRFERCQVAIIMFCFVIYFSLDTFASFLKINAAVRFSLLGLGIYLLIDFFSKLSKPSLALSTHTIKNDSVFSSLFYTNDSLLILRFFAAFCVFSTHAVCLLNPATLLLENRLIIGCAHSGMIIFFTLSGYLMGKAFVYERYNFDKDGILKFYKNRLMRIAPLAFSIFLIYVALLYPDRIKFNLLDSWRIFAFHFLGAGTQPYSLAGVGVFWSLSVEVQYYLIAPFIFYCLKDLLPKSKINVLFFALICVALVRLNTYLSQNFLGGHPTIFFSLVGQLPYFLMGFILNYLIKDFIERPARPWSKMAFYFNFFAVIVALGIFFVFLTHFQEAARRLIFILASLITCVFITALERFRLNAVSFSKQINPYTILQSLGVLSYGFYLWHSGVGAVYYERIKPVYHGLGDYFIECGSLAMIVFAISLWSYVFIERHFQRKI